MISQVASRLVVEVQRIAGLSRCLIAGKVGFEGAGNEHRRFSCLNMFDDFAAQQCAYAIKHRFGAAQLCSNLCLGEAADAAGCAQLRFLYVPHI